MYNRLKLAALLVGVFCAAANQRADAGDLPHTYCNGACCRGFVADAELLFLQPQRGEGYSNDDVFGYRTCPRVRLGYQFDNGVGVRVQYWNFDHFDDVGHQGNPSSIDTYNLDLDFYKRICCGTATTLEFAGGIRYNEYEDFNATDSNVATEFSGLGGYVGAQAWHCLGYNCRGYARGKWAILPEDRVINGTDGYDITRSQREVGVGVAHCFGVGRARGLLQAGYEWQFWDNYEDEAKGALGFNGFVIGLNVLY